MQRSRETEIPKKCPKRKKIIHHQKPSCNKSKSGLDLGAFNTRRTHRNQIKAQTLIVAIMAGMDVNISTAAHIHIQTPVIIFASDLCCLRIKVPSPYRQNAPWQKNATGTKTVSFRLRHSLPKREFNVSIQDMSTQACTREHNAATQMAMQQCEHSFRPTLEPNPVAGIYVLPQPRLAGLRVH